MKKTFVLFFLTIHGGLFAQLTNTQYLVAYKEAVNVYKEGDYVDAFARFRNLTNRNYQNAVVPYAYLYGAKSAEGKGDNYQARIYYQTVFEKFPFWDKVDVARILYGRVNLADGYFNEGLKALGQVSDRKYDKLKAQITGEYIKNVKSVIALKNLFNKYPNNKSIAKALVEKIQSSRYSSKEDMELSDRLTNQFNLIDVDAIDDENVIKVNESNLGQKKIDFGILLPFEIGSEQLSLGANRYVYELYQGMMLAAVKLTEENIKVNLHCYDVKNSATDFKVAEIKEGFKNLDLIVGPLYAGPNNLAQKFLKDNDAIQVHPTSNNVSLLKDNANAFLMQPSHSQQAKKALDYINDLGLQKTVSIYFGTARKDSLFAHIYAAEAKKRGYVITEIKRFSGGKLKEQNGHIFLAADNNLGQSFLQATSMGNLSCEILITASAFSWDKINLSLFSDNISLIYPEYIDKQREIVQNFDKLYFEKTSSNPTYYSYLGHDIIQYFASMLKKGKAMFDFQVSLGKYTDSYLLSGYDFSGKVKENDIVPIVKYVFNNFEVVAR